MRNPIDPSRPGLSRRSLVSLLTAFAASPLFVTRAFASRSIWQRAVRTASGRGAGQGRSRYQHAAVGLADGRMVAIGGYTMSEAARSRVPSPPSASVQVYEPSSGSWYDLAPLRTPRARHAAALLADGRIVVLGGFTTVPLDSVEIYDPGTDAWTQGPPLPAPMYDLAAAVCGDLIVVSGGPEGLPAVALTIEAASRFNPF